MEVYLFQTCSGTGTIVGLISCMLQQKYTFLPHSGQSSPRQQVWRPCQTKYNKIISQKHCKDLKHYQKVSHNVSTLKYVLWIPWGRFNWNARQPTFCRGQAKSLTNKWFLFSFPKRTYIYTQDSAMMHQKLSCLALGFSAAKFPMKGFKSEYFESEDQPSGKLT